MALSASVALCGLSACGEGDAAKTKGTLTGEVYAGKVVDLTPAAYESYLGLTDENEMAKLLTLYNEHNKTTPVVESKPMVLAWDRNPKATRYTVSVSDKENFSHMVAFITTQDCYASVGNLMPGVYYWRVADNLGNQTEVDYFTVGDHVRAMNVDNIRNFRDLGGWKTEDGKKLKYGMTYRCAALRETSGKALSELGVRTEVDLRAEEEYATSIISKEYGIKFLQAGIMQGDYVLKDKSFYSSLTPEQIEEKRHSEARFKQAYADALYETFKLYTDASNYPILFHCTSGADRTGTFAFLLEGLLGVEIDDLYRDFELTSFSMGGKRWRSNIEMDDAGNYYFNGDGYVTVPDNYVAIGLLYKGLMECYSTGDGKLSSAIKNYLRTDVGLTDEDFQLIRNIMLEDA